MAPVAASTARQPGRRTSTATAASRYQDRATKSDGYCFATRATVTIAIKGVTCPASLGEDGVAFAGHYWEHRVDGDAVPVSPEVPRGAIGTASRWGTPSVDRCIASTIGNGVRRRRRWTDCYRLGPR